VLQSDAMPLCVGVAVGTGVVETGEVLVVGVPGIPTQRKSPWAKFVHPEPTLGFHAMKSVFEKVPNIATISSQDSDSVSSYHILHVEICPEGRETGRFVSVAGIGRTPDENAATQYQYPSHIP
jgi:hypothetical protein